MRRIRLSSVSLIFLGSFLLWSCQLASLKRVRVAPDPVTVTVAVVVSAVNVYTMSYI
ncbi:MAG: hypothetical protein MJY49_00470 [Bacteroidales bacterium]|nr:hypothetical protein [Bacteroidales bacterium]